MQVDVHRVDAEVARTDLADHRVEVRAVAVDEAARGVDRVMSNDGGERFKGRYVPQRLELYTRDRVALPNYTEIAAGRGTERGGVLLDVSHLPREQILEKLPRVYRTLIDLQMLDITTTPIEIAPTAHYSMGGVWVRAEDHGTGVEGLYAIGEASSGLHGANRLGGNSLIEQPVSYTHLTLPTKRIV